MKLLLMIPYCSQKTYSAVFINASIQTNQQFHKYFRLFTAGLIANGLDVVVGCQFDVNTTSTKQRVISMPDESINGVRFHYFKTYNISIIGRICKFFQSLVYTFSFCMQNRGTIVICDPNKVASAFGVMMGTKLARGNLVYILSDLPSINTGSLEEKQSLRQKLADLIISKADGYYFFTKFMNDLLNKQNKPYVIIECLVDEKLENIRCNLADKYPTRVMMYTGGIVAHYGLEQLLEAFELAGVPNTELWIYGGGPYAKSLTELCAGKDTVKYLGILSNEEIVKEQMKATILVNPRLTNYEYTKYSFPSKNMEYMVSGTPTLTTRLEGIPEEYNAHVFFFDSESVEGMAKTIRDIYSHSDAELYLFGQETKEWILRNKGYTAQLRKFYERVLTTL
ncbi:putative Glycosyl transferase protein [uncultured spirochete]|uniref:Putative Glycosyl transferase protein n=1 Tax=uncultured spirochete TaxID=156406 RepID=A0A3P3XR40_9SPIR|nr:putative Glycosyl transferase protein [uncultured spirochete]